jgi:hypothetical protein
MQKEQNNSVLRVILVGGQFGAVGDAVTLLFAYICIKRQILSY